MRLPRVVSEEEYSWISLEKVRKSKWFIGFVYDWITEKDIRYAIVSKAYLTADVSTDWEENWKKIDVTNFEKHDKWKEFHTNRIAALAFATRDRGIKPVYMDINHTLPNSGGNSFINDGHHRIRAIEFRGFKCFPAYVSGSVNEIEKIVVPKHSFDLHEET